MSQDRKASQQIEAILFWAGRKLYARVTPHNTGTEALGGIVTEPLSLEEENAMPETNSTCPDCHAEMQPIKLLDATSLGFTHRAVGHTELAYAAPDAIPSAFSRSVPKAGTVKAKICPECARIILHGE